MFAPNPDRLDRLWRQAALPAEEETKPRIERLSVVDGVLTYKGERGLPGLYISGVPIAEDKSYFEIEITNVADLEAGGPVIGLCSQRYSIYLYKPVCLVVSLYLVLDIHLTCYLAGQVKVSVTTLHRENFTKEDLEVSHLDPNVRWVTELVVVSSLMLWLRTLA